MSNHLRPVPMPTSRNEIGGSQTPYPAELVLDPRGLLRLEVTQPWNALIQSTGTRIGTAS